jgi:hypothetical protein
MFIDSDSNWYHTSGDDGVNGTASAWGFLTHEFGHASGFGNGSSPEHFSTPCDTSDPANYQTMCAEPPGNPSDQDNAWRWNTLEAHDIHEFTSEY